MDYNAEQARKHAVDEYVGRWHAEVARAESLWPAFLGAMQSVLPGAEARGTGAPMPCRWSTWWMSDQMTFGPWVEVEAAYMTTHGLVRVRWNPTLGETWLFNGMTPEIAKTLDPDDIARRLRLLIPESARTAARVAAALDGSGGTVGAELNRA